MCTLPLWGRDRERNCYVAQARPKTYAEIAEKDRFSQTRSSPAKRTRSFFGPTELNQTMTF